MLINRPRRTICKIGNYDVIISSDNQLESEEKFNSFCNEFKMVLMTMVNAAQATKKPEAVTEGKA